jgi:hypothetical protein
MADTIDWNWQKAAASPVVRKTTKAVGDDELEAIMERQRKTSAPVFYGRADAKWGVFFDYFGIDYKYERGLQRDSTFTLPGIHKVLQVVPNPEAAVEKYPARLKQAIIIGEPRIPQSLKDGGIRLEVVNEQFKADKYYLWYQCPYCRKIGIIRHKDKVLPCCGEEREFDEYSDLFGLFFAPYLLSGFTAVSHAKFSESNGAITNFYY